MNVRVRNPETPTTGSTGPAPAGSVSVRLESNLELRLGRDQRPWLKAVIRPISRVAETAGSRRSRMEGETRQAIVVGIMAEPRAMCDAMR
jgi:hypothetical protein